MTGPLEEAKRAVAWVPSTLRELLCPFDLSLSKVTIAQEPWERDRVFCVCSVMDIDQRS